MLSIVINILLAVHVLVSLLIILLVLMQRPKSEGLGAAFGGGMTDNLFGAQSTNVLQTITRWLGCIFFALTLVLSLLYVKRAQHKSTIQQGLNSAPAVPAVPAVAPGATGGPDAAVMEAIQKALKEKGLEAKPTEGGALELKAEDAKPGDAKPVDAKPEGVKPADVKPAEGGAAEVKPVDVKPADPKPAEGVVPVPVPVKPAN
ncbi:MAG: preprotein translocase subunit SecG [Verrucomicrobia bacterium]|nr:preprotein translocase subunit SecG [Verrucomicrobiota bacterium]